MRRYSALIVFVLFSLLVAGEFKEYHDIWYWENGFIVDFGRASDSLQLDDKFTALNHKGISKDSIVVFYHQHYFDPDSSNIIVRNYNIGNMEYDILGGKWYDPEWWDAVLGNVNLIYMPVEW